MKPVEFYDVQEKSVVTIPADRIKKSQFTNHHGKTTYYLKGLTVDHRTLSKPVNKEYWDTAEYPVR